MNHDPADLESQIMTGLWTDIRVHLERGAVFVVATEMDMVDVGRAVVSDDVKKVTRLIEKGALTRPVATQIEAWDKMTDKSFRFLILQPYVLIQELGH